MFDIIVFSIIIVMSVMAVSGQKSKYVKYKTILKFGGHKLSELFETEFSGVELNVLIQEFKEVLKEDEDLLVELSDLIDWEPRIILSLLDFKLERKKVLALVLKILFSLRNEISKFDHNYRERIALRKKSLSGMTDSEYERYSELINQYRESRAKNSLNLKKILESSFQKERVSTSTEAQDTEQQIEIA